MLRRLERGTKSGREKYKALNIFFSLHGQVVDGLVGARTFEYGAPGKEGSYLFLHEGMVADLTDAKRLRYGVCKQRRQSPMFVFSPQTDG